MHIKCNVAYTPVLKHRKKHLFQPGLSDLDASIVSFLHSPIPPNII